MIRAQERVEVDVLVVGSGSAGATAAIAAARAGASTLLLERHGFLGGTSTAVLDTFYGFYTPGGSPRKIVGGVGDEVVARLRDLGPVIERPNTYGAGTGVTYHPEHLKVVWDGLVEGAGAKVLLYATLQDTVVDDGRVDHVVVATKAGLCRFSARCYVDASGDADLCHFAGFEYELAGELEPAQSLTTTFKLANVDLKRRLSLTKDELHAIMADAAGSGDYDLPRREGSDHITPVDGMTSTIMTRVVSFERRADGSVINASDPELLTRAEVAGRRQALEYVRFLRDRVPGYERAQLTSLSTQIGVRETRRVYGDYRLTREDVLGALQYADQIGLCGAPLEDHRSGAETLWEYIPDGGCVGIPYRTLVPAGGVNVLVAGRCFSATHDAHVSVRSMAQCMAMGQAAGEAAALAADHDGEVRAVSLGRLRDRLLASGAILE